jgi:YVTN family beta-propeller protein
MLFTTNGVSNDVTVIDTGTRKPIKSIKVGRYPWGAAVRPMPTHTSGTHETETR